MPGIRIIRQPPSLLEERDCGAARTTAASAISVRNGGRWSIPPTPSGLGGVVAFLLGLTPQALRCRPFGAGRMAVAGLRPREKKGSFPLVAGQRGRGLEF
jgi:hypothetical protein